MKSASEQLTKERWLISELPAASRNQEPKALWVFNRAFLFSPSRGLPHFLSITRVFSLFSNPQQAKTLGFTMGYQLIPEDMMPLKASTIYMEGTFTSV